MSLKNMTLKTGCTIAVTGGDTITFGEDSQNVVNGIHLVDIGQPDFRDRYQVTVKCKPATLDVKTGKLSKQKHAFSIARPYVNTDGSVEFQSLHVDISTVPGSTNIDELRLLAAQFLMSSDTAAYFSLGAMG